MASVKCARCGRAIETTFLGKLLGTYLREDGKRIAVCSACQRAGRERRP